MPSNIKVKSLSSTIQITLLENLEYEAVLEIKNNSIKDVTAYQFRLSNGSELLVDRSISGNYLKPNTVFKQNIRLPMYEDESSEKISEITLETVVFSDNSIDGNNISGKYITDRRLGIRSQLEVLLPILEGLVLNLQSNVIQDKYSFIKATRNKLDTTSYQSRNSISTGFEEGVSDIRQTAVNLLNNLEENLSQSSVNNPYEIYSKDVIELNNWRKRLEYGGQK